MTELLQMAMMLNDHAVEWMLRGDYQNAEHTLKQSFVAIRNVIHRNDNDARTAVRTTATISSSSSSSSLLQSELLFPFLLPSANSHHHQDCRILHKLCHSELFIFNRPVYFSKCNIILGDNQYNDNELPTNHASKLSILCSGIVLFNMALILHLRGIMHNNNDNSNDKSSSLKKANHLYISTFQLMKNLQANEGFLFFPNDTTSILSELYLSSFNNYALICIELKEYKRAQDAAHSMRSILLSSSTILMRSRQQRQPPHRPNNNNGGGLQFSEEEWDGFATNIEWILSLSLALPTTCEIPNGCGAPAA